MPFTPFHFGPHACLSLPLHRYMDIPIFIGVNVAVDIEPLLVMVFDLDYPLHGYCHTLLIGGMIGLLFASMAYPLRGLIGMGMKLFKLPYAPTYLKMAASGILGAWLHVLFDAPLYADIKPFFPSAENPLRGILSPHTIYGFCTISFLPALALYLFVVIRAKARGADKNPCEKNLKKD
jgi:membrane-bound metal-dependent hydrolase YbcI (DUF457 family)